MQMPPEYQDYPGDEYFRDGWAESGYFDEPTFTLLIVPLDEAYENSEVEFFAIGRSGADGIDFGYRKEHAGLWAFYPINAEFKFMAATVRELVDGWTQGQLYV